MWGGGWVGSEQGGQPTTGISGGPLTGRLGWTLPPLLPTLG